MNLARKMVLVAIGCSAWMGAKAQVNCSLSTSTQLACIVPYRTNGITSSAAVNNASFFSGPIGAQLSQLPLAASAPGVVILTIGGNPENYPNLGPILIDRPDSVGQGKLVLGFSAQQFDFNHLDGIGIDSIPFNFQLSSSAYYQQTIHASIKYNQYVLVGTYGFPKKTDVSVILPFSHVSIGVATIKPTQYTFSSSTGVWGTSPALGTDSTGAYASAYTDGSASGPGDLIVNAKHVLWGGETSKGSLATGVAVRLPTGYALNYLGSGAYGVNLYGLAAYKAKVSPHVKVAYQWNSNSVLLNVSGTEANHHLPGGLQTAIGADYAANKHLTISADLLANEFQNSPSVTSTQITLTDTASPNTKHILPTVASGFNTFTTANLSGGLKWKPSIHRGLILYGNALVQVNDVGLRSRPSPSFGVSYNFAADHWPKWLYR